MENRRLNREIREYFHTLKYVSIPLKGFSNFKNEYISNLFTLTFEFQLENR